MRAGVRNIFMGLICAFWAVSCYDDVTLDTEYVLKPFVRVLSDQAIEPQSGVVVYAFGVDSTSWQVASYDDALEGILTSKSDPSDKMSTPLAVGAPYTPIDTLPESATWLTMSIQQPSVMLVAVDPANKLYAYRQQTLVENLDFIYVSVLFQPWRESNKFQEGSWWILNDFYVPTEPETEVVP